jgi:flagellar secretion chaperone FliS
MAVQYSGCDVYKKVNIETASQGKLIVMLFNGAIQRAEEAKRQLDRGRIDGVHNNLIRAQDIIAELRHSLNMEAGGLVAGNLDRIYEYYQHLLVKGNIQKDPLPIDECINLMKPLRDTWAELFDLIAKNNELIPTPNKPAASTVNLQG